MTQAEAADALGVAHRTIGNWERGRVIPERHWATIAAVFPKADLPFPSSSATLQEDLETQFRRSDILRRAEDVSAAWRSAKLPSAAGATHEQQQALFEGASTSLDWVETAVSAGISAQVVEELTKGITHATFEAAALAFRGDLESIDLVTDIAYRAGSLAELARRRDASRSSSDETPGASEDA